ncbi:hypothetical protein AX17_000593 [Amanita inopinata Kibby_2008]|nr:hypothetical protein AX17_000593 [Amanita inopinata Kibby_2008]
MSSRSSRSSGIPIPRASSSTSPSRNIEMPISIPFAASRHRFTNTLPRHSDSSGHVAAGISVSASPARSIPSNHARGLPRSVTTFEPRIIRATSESSRNTDSACLPSTSTSPMRTRRPSATVTTTLGIQRHTSGQTFPPPSTAVAFARPSYLDHSALHHMLQTELPPSFPSSRKAEPQISTHHRHSGAMSPSTDSDDDSNATPPRDPPPAVPPLLLPSDQVLRLPTRWSDQMKHSSLSVSADGRDLTYNGSTCNGDKDAAAARTGHPIPPACGIYYYEVEILSKGQKGHISIGFAGRDVKLNRLPGWESNSWGYHGDDGCSFAAEKNGNPYGPTYGTGDVIGCGVDFTTYKAFFTKNGTLLGTVFEGIGRDTEIYPSVGLRHNGEIIRVNFGHEPFKFDIDYHVQQQRNSTWRKILSVPLDRSLIFDRTRKRTEDKVEAKGKYVPRGPVTEAQTKNLMNKLVLSYLVHHGYAKTARSLQKQQATLGENLANLTKLVTKAEDQDMDMDPVEQKIDLSNLEDDIECRTRIVNAVVVGDIDLAISETAKSHPIVLEAETGLMLFKLRCRKFVELVLEASELKKKYKAGEMKKPTLMEADAAEEMDWMSMDVDDDVTISPSPINAVGTNGFATSTSVRSGKGKESTTMLVEQALNRAITYGQTLANDYKGDTRPEVKHLFKRTFAIVAWDDPREASGIIADVVSTEARTNLANELNQAILRSQGHPTRPALEMLCRHTAACITQLGLLGVGAAAFADMSRELLGES